MKKFYAFSFALFALLTSSCSNKVPANDHGKIMALSLSSNGQYVISTDISRHAVLWDLKQHAHKIIGSKINIYSAYFVKNTNNFMYQNDINNEVIIRNLNGDIVKKIQPGFPTYGQIITSNLQTHFSSDNNFNVFRIKNGVKTRIFYYSCPSNSAKPLAIQSNDFIRGCSSFGSAGKLFNLTLTPNENRLIGSSTGYVLIWDAKSGKLIHNLQKNDTPNFATLSPDGKFIVSGDQNFNSYIFATYTGKTTASSDFRYNPKTHQTFDTTYKNNENGWGPNRWIGRTTTIKFIDKNHYLVIFNMASGFMQNGFHYAGLFELGKNKATKYLNLLAPNKPNQPYPTTQDYDRDQAIDTSPTAHILVMAQAHNNGILVYKYNPKTQTLKQIWAPVIK